MAPGVVWDNYGLIDPGYGFMIFRGRLAALSASSDMTVRCMEFGQW